jgi:hypothetical protein
MRAPPDPAPTWHHYAVVEAATGQVLSAGRHLYDPRTPPPPPALAEGHVAVEITEAQYELAGRQALRLIDGELHPFAPERPLEQAKAEAVARVDREAERARQALLTPGAGQAIEYRATADEARRLLDLRHGPADPNDYPFLAAEQDAQAAVGGAKTLEDIAAAVLAADAAWVAVGARIKRLRREAKLRIQAATTPAEVEAASAGIAW